MEDIKSKVNIGWDEIETLVDILVREISDSNYNFTSIYGIPRGGLIPSVLLSHKLEIPLSMGSIDKHTLIVDDICDSGVTFQEMYERYQSEFAFPLDLKFACLHYRSTSSYSPNFVGRKVVEDDWLVYPWENKKAEAIQDYLKKPLTI